MSVAATTATSVAALLKIQLATSPHFPRFLLRSVVGAISTSMPTLHSLHVEKLASSANEAAGAAGSRLAVCEDVGAACVANGCSLDVYDLALAPDLLKDTARSMRFGARVGAEALLTALARTASDGCVLVYGTADGRCTFVRLRRAATSLLAHATYSALMPSGAAGGGVRALAPHPTRGALVAARLRRRRPPPQRRRRPRHHRVRVRGRHHLRLHAGVVRRRPPRRRRRVGRAHDLVRRRRRRRRLGRAAGAPPGCSRRPLGRLGRLAPRLAAVAPARTPPERPPRPVRQTLGRRPPPRRPLRRLPRLLGDRRFRRRRPAGAPAGGAALRRARGVCDLGSSPAARRRRRRPW